MSWLLKVTHMWVTFNNKKGRLFSSFHLCHILPGIATLVILGTGKRQSEIESGQENPPQSPFNKGGLNISPL